jgi:hypothetical protein
VLSVVGCVDAVDMFHLYELFGTIIHDRVVGVPFAMLSAHDLDDAKSRANPLHYGVADTLVLLEE